VLDLSSRCVCSSRVVEILLQIVGKLNDLPEFNSELPDLFVVVVDSPCLVSFEHCSKLVEQEPESRLDLCLSLLLFVSRMACSPLCWLGTLRVSLGWLLLGCHDWAPLLA